MDCAANQIYCLLIVIYKELASHLRIKPSRYLILTRNNVTCVSVHQTHPFMMRL